VLQEPGRYLLKQVLKEWEERIITAFCKGLVTITSSPGEEGQRLLGEKGMDKEMATYLKSKGYLKASGYLQRAGERLFTYVEIWLLFILPP
jgi:hypothetical protein